MPDIFLYNGEVITSDVKLRDPTVLSGSQTLTASALVNSNSFGADSVRFTYTASGVSNTAAFGAAVVSSGASGVTLNASSLVNVSGFGNATIAHDGPVAIIDIQTGGDIPDRLPDFIPRIRLKTESIVNENEFGKPIISVADNIRTLSFKNTNLFGVTRTDIEPCDDEEAILMFMMAA